MALQRRLVGHLVELTHALDAGRLPRLSLPPKYLAAKLARAVPVLSGEPIPLPVALLAPALLRLCDALAEGGAGAPADRIRATLVETRLDPGSLLNASLARDQHAVRAAAVQQDLSADLLWLVAELAASPFAHALQRMLFQAPRADPAALEALARWQRGYCAACGSWPALAELIGEERVLRCSFCALAWTVTPPACAYCGEAGVPFRSEPPDPARPGRRIEFCTTCKGYLKVIAAEQLSPFPLLAIADLASMDLDLAAMELGYHRPPLKSFTR